MIQSIRKKRYYTEVRSNMAVSYAKENNLDKFCARRIYVRRPDTQTDRAQPWCYLTYNTDGNIDSHFQ